MSAVHRYPALYLALALGAGVALAGQLPRMSAFAGLVVCCVSLAGILVWRWWFGRRLLGLAALWGTGTLLTAGMGLGAAGNILALRHIPANGLALHLPAWEADAELVGVVRAPPVEAGDRVSWTLDVDSVRFHEGWRPASGGVRLTLRQPHVGIVAGQHIRLHARLVRPAVRRNPADFSYREYLVRQGIHMVGLVANDPPIELLQSPRGLDLLLQSVRAAIAGSLTAHVVGEEARGILEALLAGDRDGLSPERRALLARTGLAHLLAVSGLHVLLVGLLLYQFLGPLLTRLGWTWRSTEVVRAGLTLAILTGYTVLVGAGPSVVRALTMAVAMLLGHVMQRPIYPINSLSLAAVVLLFFRPASLFDVGFQLSFAAVGAIVLWVPGWQALLPSIITRRRWMRWVADMLVVSLAATLGTAPVMLYHFGQLALAGILLNVPAIPAGSLALAAGLLTVLVHPIAPGVAGLFGAVAEFAAEAVMFTATVGDTFLPFLNVDLSLRGFFPIVTLLVSLAALHAGVSARWRWRCVLLAMALVAASVLKTSWRTPEVSVVYFDVGQGDAALVTFPNGRTMLVDGGPASPYNNQGERTLLPHLRKAGVGRVDVLVITHPHLDHLGGAPAVLEAMPVGQLIISGSHREGELARALETTAEARSVPVRIATAGDTLAVDPSVHVLVLSPVEHLRRHEDPNEASVVLRLQYGATRFLFLGDAEVGAEASMAARFGGLLQADVVKVGHHGSRTSSTPGFVSRVAGPRGGRAIFSVARENRYGLPDEEIWARWEAHGYAVLATYRHGAIWVTSDGETIRRVDWPR